MKRHRILFVLIAGLALLLAACSSAPPPPLEITVEAHDDFEYHPGQIEALTGQRVMLTFVNTGALEHDFSIMHISAEDVEGHSEMSEEHEEDMHEMHEAPELHISAMAGMTSTLEFTPMEPGTYEFHCTVEGHKEAGMVGTLVVQSP